MCLSHSEAEILFGIVEWVIPEVLLWRSVLSGLNQSLYKIPNIKTGSNQVAMLSGESSHRMHTCSYPNPKQFTVTGGFSCASMVLK